MKHKIYFVSDLHFGHANVIDFDKRPWPDLESMTQDLIANWNAAVTNADTVYILGDLFWTHESAHEVLPHLKGRKILIRGNHDECITEYPEIAAQFTEIHDYLELEHAGLTLILSHYPIVPYLKCYKRNTLMLYGHVHNAQDEWITRIGQKLSIESFELKAEDPNSNRGGLDVSRHPNTFAMINVGVMMPYMDWRPQPIHKLLEAAHQLKEETKAASLDELIAEMRAHI